LVDLYKILEISNSASAEEIKKAYRKLAKKYHPDISEFEDAETRFKEVSIAYNVLSCPKQKAEYDAYRLCGSLSFGDSSSNLTKKCKSCAGLGHKKDICFMCGGNGDYWKKVKYGPTMVPSRIICTSCQGYGSHRVVCHDCDGLGTKVYIRKEK
tara:strand:- start:208 stop:669 length:462 start_codon:yes stop_codon:yes gene_type:complete